MRYYWRCVACQAEVASDNVQPAECPECGHDRFVIDRRSR